MRQGEPSRNLFVGQVFDQQARNVTLTVSHDQPIEHARLDQIAARGYVNDLEHGLCGQPVAQFVNDIDLVRFKHDFN